MARKKLKRRKNYAARSTVKRVSLHRSSASSFGIRISESYISLILGFLVVLVGAILLFTFSKNRTYDRINTAVSTYQELTTPDQKQDSGVKTYEVKSGDSLWGIADKVYGSGYNWVDLVKANNISDPGIITAGTKLTIPDVPKITVESPQVQNNSPSIASSSITGSTYTIQKGDCLWNISVRAYGDGYKWKEIARVNNLQTPDLIFSGNVLQLPR